MIFNWLSERLLEVIFSGLLTSIVILAKRINKVYHSMKQNDEDAKRVDVILIKTQIRELTIKCIDRGYVYPDERRLLDELFIEYEKLGGNGVIARLYRVCQGLPDSFELKKDKRYKIFEEHKKGE